MHNIDDCPHNPTFEAIGKTLDRIDRHTERSALAMEEIAKQGVMLLNHEKRLNKHDQDLKEGFERIRSLEKQHLIELGAEQVEEKHQKFWDGIKQQSTPYAFTLLFFVVWLADKFNVVQMFTKLFKEMKG